MDDDDVLSELINEIDENEESGSEFGNKQKVSITSTHTSVISEKQATREYVKTFYLPKGPSVASIINKENEEQKSEENDVSELSSNTEVQEEEQETSRCNTVDDSVFDDDFDVTLVEDFEVNKTPVQTDVTEEQLLNGWETMQQGVENTTQKTVIVNAEELPVIENEEGKEVAFLENLDIYQGPDKKI